MSGPARRPKPGARGRSGYACSVRGAQRSLEDLAARGERSRAPAATPPDSAARSRARSFAGRWDPRPTFPMDSGESGETAQGGLLGDGQPVGAVQLAPNPPGRSVHGAPFMRGEAHVLILRGPAAVGRVQRPWHPVTHVDRAQSIPACAAASASVSVCAAGRAAGQSYPCLYHGGSIWTSQRCCRAAYVQGSGPCSRAWELHSSPAFDGFLQTLRSREASE
jgi:hypothetical protein